jgi:hypothetical protein
MRQRGARGRVGSGARERDGAPSRRDSRWRRPRRGREPASGCSPRTFPPGSAGYPCRTCSIGHARGRVAVGPRTSRRRLRGASERDAKNVAAVGPVGGFLRTENSAGQKRESVCGKTSVGGLLFKGDGWSVNIQRELFKGCRSAWYRSNSPVARGHFTLNARLSRDDVDRGPSDRRKLLAHKRSGRARITVGAVNDRLLFAPTRQSTRARAGRSVAWKGRATIALASRAS